MRSCVLIVGLLVFASIAKPVEYVKICSLYGSGFQYVPGTDICWDNVSGEAIQATEGGTWRSYLPYPE